MTHIPITFEFEGKVYAGFFSQVMGAGSGAVFHLMIGNYFYGMLMYTNEWVFHSPKGFFKGMDQFFGDYVTAWHESNSIL